MKALTGIRNRERFFWPLLPGIVFLALWHVTVKWTGSSVFPSPMDVEKGLAELAHKGLLGGYAWDSLRRVSIGFSAAALLGIPAGLTVGLYPALAQVVNPLIQMVRPISPIAWIPISIVWFGVGDAAAIFLIFLAAFFPIVVSAMNGARNVPSMFRQAGRNFGLEPVQLLTRVILPASVPQILIGLRTALGIAWLVVVAAEMIAVDSGLGYLVMDARNSGKRYDLVVAAMFLIGILGLILDLAIQQVQTLKSVRWGFRNDS